MSTLIAITILHLSAGVVVAAYFSDKVVSQVGLLVISALFGLIALRGGAADPPAPAGLAGGCCPDCSRRWSAPT